MSKAVLISIRPEWCEKIASGEKTIEVRKTRPKLQTPFKCYIYMTEGNASYPVSNDMICHNAGGKCVIGEFVCNKIFDIYEFSCSRFWLNEALLKDTCLSYDEIKKYAGAAEEIYGWHISDLKIYDTPKSLGEFYRPCTPTCEYRNACGTAIKCLFPIQCPPQSFMYVEAL